MSNFLHHFFLFHTLALGHVKAIGVSNYLIRHLDEMKTYSSVVPAVNQVQAVYVFRVKEITMHKVNDV